MRRRLRPGPDEAQAFLAARASGDADVLLNALRKPALRHSAAYALADIGETRAIPGLVRLLRANDPHLRIAAARSLGRLQAIEALEQLCELADTDPVPLVREWAVYSIGVMGDVSSREWLVTTALEAPDQFSTVALAGLVTIDAQAAQHTLSQRTDGLPAWRRWRLRRVADRTSKRMMRERRPHGASGHS
jgi:HEAT repeat protein